MTDLKTALDASLNNPLLALRLHIKDERAVGQHTLDGSLCVDVFPHRIFPDEGWTHQDVILTFIASAVKNYYASDRYNVNIIDLDPFTQPGPSYHPDFVLQKGAFCAHETLEDSPGVRISTNATTIDIPGLGLHLIEDFVPPHIFNPRHAHSDCCSLDYMTDGSAQDGTFDAPYALLTGVAQAFVGAPLQKRFPAEIGGAVLGRAFRMLKDRPSGKAGFAKGSEDGRYFMHKLMNTWTLRPDRAWMPSKYVSSPRLERLVKHFDERMVMAGTEMAKVALDFDIKSSQDVYAEGDSAHQTIRLKAAVDAIDTALLRHMPPELLTPLFAKRAAKQQNT